MARKIKIVANDDFVPDYNFGYPCIVHGIERILDTIYGIDGYELIIYTHSEFREEIANDYKAILKPIGFSPTNVLKSAMLSKIGIPTKDKEVQGILQDVKEADLIVGLYPIVWCGTFYKNKKNSYKEVLKMVLGNNMLLFLGKLFKKKTVKTVCSVGPMSYPVVARAAKVSVKHLWDKIYVREKKSREELLPYISKKKEICVVPDLANVMEYQQIEQKGRKPVGISVSFQIIQQWKGDKDYVHCIATLCEAILENTQEAILLVPNEYTPSLELDDIMVANDILNVVLQKDSSYQKRIKVLEIEQMTSQQVKNTIASCEVLVASRYHSCVAALSAGVPTLVVGWHWKYQELLELYEQENWAVTTESCNEQILKQIFDEFWKCREDIRNVLAKRQKEVYHVCFDAGKDMFAVDK